MSEQIHSQYDYQLELPNGTLFGIERGALEAFIRDTEQEGDTQLSLNLDEIMLPINDALVEGIDLSNQTSGAICLEATIQFADSSDAANAFAGMAELAKHANPIRLGITNASVEPNSKDGKVLRLGFNAEDDDTSYLLFLDSTETTIQIINKGALEEGKRGPIIIMPESFDDISAVDQVVRFCIATTEVVQLLSQAVDPHVNDFERNQAYVFQAFDVMERGRHKRNAQRIGSTVLKASELRDEISYRPTELQPSDPLKLRFDHIAGYEAQKDQLRDILLLFHNQDTAKRWAIKPPRGLLLYGPPGTGKTTLARACATELGAELAIVTNDNVYDMYVGNSAKNLTEIFDEAEATDGPAVLLFDEIDSIIRGSGNSGVDKSVLGVFKSRMSGLRPNVFVIGTTNHRDDIDPAIMRSGRFDEKIGVPLPSESDRAAIFSAYIASSSVNGLNFRELTKKSKKIQQRDIFAQDIDSKVLAAITEDFSGADIEEILRRIRNKKAIHEIKTGEMSKITQDDLLLAIQEFNRQ